MGELLIRVKDWVKRHETPKSIDVHQLEWVPSRLMCLLGRRRNRAWRKNARIRGWAAAYGIYRALVEVAAQADKPRVGNVSDDEGPLGIDDLEEDIGIPASEIRDALDILTRPDVGMIELLDADTGQPWDPASSGGAGLFLDEPTAEPQGEPIEPTASAGHGRDSATTSPRPDLAATAPRPERGRVGTASGPGQDRDRTATAPRSLRRKNENGDGDGEREEKIKNGNEERVSPQTRELGSSPARGTSGGEVFSPSLPGPDSKRGEGRGEGKPVGSGGTTSGGIPSGINRQHGFGRFQLAAQEIWGTFRRDDGTMGRHPPNESKYLADRTSTPGLYDLVWPEDVEPEAGRQRLAEALSLVEQAKSNGDIPMAWLTSMIKRMGEAEPLGSPEPPVPVAAGAEMGEPR